MRAIVSFFWLLDKWLFLADEYKHFATFLTFCKKILALQRISVIISNLYFFIYFLMRAFIQAKVLSPVFLFGGMMSLFMLLPSPAEAAILKSLEVTNLTRPGALTEANPAGPGDRIQYTLTTENTGPNRKVMDVVDDVSDILPYVVVDDLDGGELNSNRAKVTWEDVELLGHTIVSKNLIFKIRDATQWSNYIHDNVTYNLMIKNRYGNREDVYLSDFSSADIDIFVEVTGRPETRVGEGVRNSGVLRVAEQSSLTYTLRIQNTGIGPVLGLNLEHFNESLTDGEALRDIRNIRFPVDAEKVVEDGEDDKGFKLIFGRVLDGGFVDIQFEATTPAADASVRRSVRNTTTIEKVHGSNTMKSDYVDIEVSTSNRPTTPTAPPAPRSPSGALLTVKQFYNPTQGSVGQNVTYRVEAKNVGSTTLNNVLVNGPVPENVSYTSSTMNGRYDPRNNRVQWTLDELQPGEVRTFQVTGRVTSSPIVSSPPPPAPRVTPPPPPPAQQRLVRTGSATVMALILSLSVGFVAVTRSRKKREEG